MGTIATELCSKVEVVSRITISVLTTDSLWNFLADPDWNFLVYELADRLDPFTDLLGLLGADLLLHLLTDRGGDRGADLLRDLLTLLATQRHSEGEGAVRYLLRSLPWNIGGIVGAV